MQRILRIDLGAGGPRVSVEAPGRYAGLGGRALASAIVAEEVDPACHPLDAANRLVLAPGLLAALPTSSCGRISAGCKSPLTGGVAASSAGGRPGGALARLGYAAVILEGQPAGDQPWKLVVDRRGVTISADDGCRLLGNHDTVARLRELHGERACFLTIGQAGELRLGAASISCTDDGGRPTSRLGSGGAGAVMGSKKLKAIVVDDGAPGGGPAARATAPGAAAGSPAGTVAREARRGCETRRSHRDHCGIDDPEILAELERLYDDLGLDAAEMGAALGAAAEAGLARFGDGDAALRLMGEVRRGTPLGRILGSGAAAAAKAFGVERATAPAPPPASPSEDERRWAELAVAAAALDALGASALDVLPEQPPGAAPAALPDRLAVGPGLVLARGDLLALGCNILETEHRFDARAGVARGGRQRRAFLEAAPASHETLFPADERVVRLLAALRRSS